MDIIKVFKAVRLAAFNVVLNLFPVNKKKIVFDSFIGQGYKGNPKYIAEEILKQNLDYDLVWLLTDMSSQLPEGIRGVQYASVKSFIELATAGLWIFDCRGVFHPKKKNNQLYIHTGHSPFGVKRSEQAAEDTLDPDYIKQAKEDGRITNAIISDGYDQTNQFKTAFWLNKNAEILKIGLPRNDYLINNKDNTSLRNKLRKQFGIDDSDILVMYEPTFRDDYSLDGYRIDFTAVKNAFEELTGKKCFIGIRLHPVVKAQSLDIKFGDTVLNLTDYQDIQELSIAGDVVISDYSTTVFDFVLLHKPVFICALDLKHYEETRGLNKEFYEYPFPVSTTNEELINDIEAFDSNEYEKQVEEYFKMRPIYDKGTASKKTVEWIKNNI